jgi:Zn-dependent alcohol dehydrogenase
LVPVDPSLPLDLLGPLACGLSTGVGAVLNVLRPHAGSSIVVYGAVGLAAIMAVRNSGATRIIAVDRHEQGRFPFDELITHFPVERINAAEAGEVIKPVLRMP